MLKRRVQRFWSEEEKRLERDRFVWPSAAGGKMVITAAQLSMLLKAIDWRTPLRTWRPLDSE